MIGELSNLSFHEMLKNDQDQTQCGQIEIWIIWIITLDPFTYMPLQNIRRQLA